MRFCRPDAPCLAPRRWYNVPPEPAKKKAQKAKNTAGAGAGVGVNGVDAGDSAPLNFDTFVPTHDPSLAAAAAGGALPSMDGAGAEMANVGQDEAFSRAMAAMYWSGYWTAVYHVSSLFLMPYCGGLGLRGPLYSAGGMKKALPTKKLATRRRAWVRTRSTSKMMMRTRTKRCCRRSGDEIIAEERRPDCCRCSFIEWNGHPCLHFPWMRRFGVSVHPRCWRGSCCM